MRAPAGLAVVVLLAAVAAPAAAQTAADLFNDEIVHEINLVMRASDWEMLRANYLEDFFYVADFVWRYQGREVAAPEIGIRSRGLGSRSGAKPGLLVSFDKYEATQHFLGLNSVVLRNNTQEPSMMRERLSMLLFRRMGVPASREAHARVSINGRYFGLYTIVENINKAFLDSRFQQSEGHLYEYRWAEDYRFQYRGSDLSRYSPTPFKPETHIHDPDIRPLEGMVRTMNQAADGDFARAMAPYLDLKQFMTHVAVENYLAEIDGVLGFWGLNNFYLYRFEGGTLSQFIPWDKSETFHAADHPIAYNVEDNVLMRRARRIPEFNAAYLEALRTSALLAGGPGGWLEQELGRVYEQTRLPAYEDTHKQWGGRPSTNEEFDGEVARMVEFARQRPGLVLEQIASAGFQLPPGAARVYRGGVVNALNPARMLTPGAVVSVYGEQFGGVTAVADSAPLPATLGGVSVIINGFAAPLLYVSPNQINLQLPANLRPGTMLLTVVVNGAPGHSIEVSIDGS